MGKPSKGPPIKKDDEKCNTQRNPNPKGKNFRSRRVSGKGKTPGDSRRDKNNEESQRPQQHQSETHRAIAANAEELERALEDLKLQATAKVVIEDSCKRLGEEALKKQLGVEVEQSESSTETEKKIQKSKKTKTSADGVTKTKSSDAVPQARRASPRFQPVPKKLRRSSPRSTSTKQGVPVVRARPRKALVNALSRLRSRPSATSKKAKSATSTTSPNYSRRKLVTVTTPTSTSPTLTRTLRVRKPSSTESPSKKENSKETKVQSSAGQTSTATRKGKKKVFHKMDNAPEKSSEPQPSTSSSSSQSPSKSQEAARSSRSSDQDHHHDPAAAAESVTQSLAELSTEDDYEDALDDYLDDSDEEDTLLPIPSTSISSGSKSGAGLRKRRHTSSTSVHREHDPYELHTSEVTSTPIPSYTSIRSMGAGFHSPGSSSSPRPRPLGVGNTPSPEKRGRGRPRKPLEDVKSVSGKLYRRKLAAESSGPGPHEESDEVEGESRLHLQNPHFHDSPSIDDQFADLELGMPTTSGNSGYNQTQNETTRAGSDSAGAAADSQSSAKRGINRWKDKSTFVYAKHKFVNTGGEEKFKCTTCNVTFTALSSLKRHYNTIYHKQQEANGRTVDFLSDLQAPSTSQSSTSQNSQSSGTGKKRGRGSRGHGALGQPRTSNVVRRDAVGSIKRFYLNADAARRKREISSVTTTSDPPPPGRGGTQKIPRKRKPPAYHQDFVPTSGLGCSSYSNDYNQGGGGGSDNYFNFFNDDIENNYPEEAVSLEEEREIENLIQAYSVDTSTPVKPWQTNVWKGDGPAHFTCEVCGEVYQNKWKFTDHLFKHRQEEEEAERRRALTCPDCQVTYLSEAVFRQHLKLFKHGSESDGMSCVKRFSCHRCRSQFSKREYYVKHLEIYRRPKAKCPHCEETFQYRFYLKDHLKEVHAEQLGNSSSNSTTMSNCLSNNGLPNLMMNNLMMGSTATTSLPNLSANSNNLSSHSCNPLNAKKTKAEVYSATTKLTQQPSTTTTGGRRKSLTSTTTSAPTPSPSTSSSSHAKKKSAPGRPPRSSQKSDDSENLDNFERIVPNMEDVTEESTSTSTSTPGPSRPKERVDVIEKFFDSQRNSGSSKEASGNSSSRDENVLRTSLDITFENSTTATVNETANVGTEQQQHGHSGAGAGTSSGGGESREFVLQFEPDEGHTIFDDFAQMQTDVCGFSPLTIEIPMTTPTSAPTTSERSGASGNGNETVVDMKVNSAPAVAVAVPSTSSASMATAASTSSVGQGSSHSQGQGQGPKPSTSGSSSSLHTSSLTLIGCGNRPSGDPQAPRPPEDPLTCQDCGKVFEHRKSLVKHVRYYTQSEDYHCSICNKAFKLKHHVTRHMKSTHNVDTSSTTSSTSADTRVEDLGDMDFLNSPGSGGGCGGGGGSGSGPPPPGAGGSTTGSTGTGTTTTTAFTLIAMLPRSHTLPLPMTSALMSPIITSSRTKRSSSTSAKSVAASGSTGAASSKKQKSSGSGASRTSGDSTDDSYETVVDSNGTMAFKCIRCKILYPSILQVNAHACSALPFTHRCPKCNKGYKLKHELNAHQLIHNVETPRVKHTCDQCKKSFSWKKDLAKHQREKHEKEKEKEASSSTSTSASTSSSSKSGKKQHQQQPQEDLVSRCSYCPLVFPQESDLGAHVAKEHKKSVSCQQCGLIYGSRELLEEHIDLEHNDKVKLKGQEVDDDNDNDNDEDDDDEDGPPTPSPHTSPLHRLSPHGEEDDEEEDEDTEVPPSSPEFELLELN